MWVSVNPATGEQIQLYPTLDAVAMDFAIARAQRAFVDWRCQSYDNRGETLMAIAAGLRDQKQELARLMALEMGKPIKEGVAEVEKSAWCAEYYAANAKSHLQRETIESDASLSYVYYPPLGVVLGILPWNAPLWLAFRFLAPALMAGNTCVMKHDPNVPGCAQAIEKIIHGVDGGEHIVVNLPIENHCVEQAIRHQGIAAVSFTGSSRTGRLVARTAAEEVKPSVLELGGSDPLVILADADLDKACDVACISRIINAGQSCIAAKRIIVEEPVYDRVLDKLSARLSRLKLGDPLLAATDVGPIARRDLQQNLHRQVTSSISQGARCLLGGELPEGSGFYYPVTLLADAQLGMCAMDEETFGPVMVVAKVADAEQALALANHTDYGLGSSVWTEDKALQQHFIDNLQSGQVAVNGIVKTDPRLPCGGIKKSGLGRELGPHGIKEFVNVKQVWIG